MPCLSGHSGRSLWLHGGRLPPPRPRHVAARTSISALQLCLSRRPSIAIRGRASKPRDYICSSLTGIGAGPGRYRPRAGSQQFNPHLRFTGWCTLINSPHQLSHIGCRIRRNKGTIKTAGSDVPNRRAPPRTLLLCSRRSQDFAQNPALKHQLLETADRQRTITKWRHHGYLGPDGTNARYQYYGIGSGLTNSRTTPGCRSLHSGSNLTPPYLY